MPRNNRAVRNVSGLVLALFLACSCASSAAAPAAGGAKPKPPTTTATMDAYACTSVQALLGHLAVGTAHWSPTRQPFDQAIAVQIRTASANLQKQLPRVRTVAVFRAVSSSANAFNAGATAMTLKKRSQVSRAISATQVAFRNLKKVCGA
jgi:hypothetical protein